MSADHGAVSDYAATLDRLEAELRAGRARYAAWATEEAELLEAITALKAVMARQGGRQIPLPLSGAVGGPAQPGIFQGLTYKAAIKKYFEMMGRPLKAPEVADGLFQAGYAKERKVIKTNVDSMFKRLREDGVLQQVGAAGSAYELVGNGNHS